MKKLVLLLLLAIAFALISGWTAQRFLQSPMDVPADGLLYDIRPGVSFATISHELGEAGLIERPTIFRWYARLTDQASRVHAGRYRIEQGITPIQLLRKFVEGRVELYAFTIVEGWTFNELLNNLASHPAVEGSLTYDDWPTLLVDLGSDATHPEGLFLPETYRFPYGTSNSAVLRQAYDMMQSTLRVEWQNRTADLPIVTPYEALILASIIEKETGRPDERERIAGVFVRRLQQGMRLQTDPTVIYGIGADFDGNITRRHLQTDTEYNTYTRGGLPPTPIALPGRAAIHAALNPAAGTELFFVATGLGDGSHAFSDTIEQHNAAVQEYLKRLRRSRALNSGAQ
ncbi:MAG: endolytic transglycosylase MltG [Woeseia sp.]